MNSPLTKLHYKDSSGQKRVFDPKSIDYFGVKSTFIQMDDGIICILAGPKDDTPENNRRNVMKITYDGKIIWIVKDKMDIWEKMFPNNLMFFKAERYAGFDSIS